jgi:hypothetical protein
VSRRKPRRQASKTAATKTAGSASQMLKRSMMAADLNEPSAKKHKVSVAESKARVATKSLLEQLQESRNASKSTLFSCDNLVRLKQVDILKSKFFG